MTERRIVWRVLFAAIAVTVVVFLAMLIGVVRMARHRTALVEALSRYETSSVVARYEPFHFSPPPSMDLQGEDGRPLLRLYWRGGQRVLGFSVGSERPFWADWIANIFDNDPFAEIQDVMIRDERFCDAEVSVLLEFPGIRVLELSETGITDGGVALLAKNSRLVKLDLSQTQITDHSLQALDKLPELRELDISNTRTTKEAAESFQKRHPRCLVFD
jgi:Leucine Rich Repeat (LRR) protein